MKDVADIDYTTGGFPQDVGKIIHTKCAVSGCHTNLNKDQSEGLSYETWEQLFAGGDEGAVVIPFRPDFSILMYHINSYSEFGPIQLDPKMPKDAEPLSQEEVKIIHDWIQRGAPNALGHIKFSDYQNRRKLYIANKGCDVVTIMDPETGLAMRYIDVGISPAIEAPSMVKVSPDNLYWYVIFNASTIIQKFRTSDNVCVGTINIGAGIWTSMAISSDSRTAFITDIQFNGKIVVVDLDTMQVTTTYQTGLQDPFAICVDNSTTNLYVVPQLGNFIYKINIASLLSPIITEISMETGMPVNYASSLDPYSILLSDDETKYFVVCRTSAELRFFQTSNDSLLQTIPVGSNAANMVYSSSTPHLFVSCEGAPPTRESAIYVFNHQTNAYVLDMYAGFDSRAIILDETGGKLFVANRNVSSGGPIPHHESVCAGKNGYMTAIDINSLLLIEDFEREISVDPHSIDISN